MSLLIVGSCSRVTQSVVTSLAKLQQYQNITILDLLPVYNFHQRFYNLQHQLSTLNSTTKVNIQKIINVECLASNIKAHQDLLFVTHDYFQSVTSKTKLMELTAQLSGNVSNHPFRRRQSSPPPSSTITSDFQIPKPLSGNHSKKFRRQTSTPLSSDPIFKMRPSSLLTSITPSPLWEDVLSVFLHLSTLKSPVLRSTLKQWLML